MISNIKASDTLREIIIETGIISIADSQEKLDNNQLVIALPTVNLFFSVPNNTSPEQQLKIKEQILGCFYGLDQLQTLSRKYIALQKDFQTLVDSAGKKDFEKSLLTNLLLFLGKTEQFALLKDNQIIDSHNLNQHSLQITRLQLKRKNEYAVRIAAGQLFAFRHESYTFIVERNTQLSNTEKNHIKLTIQYIALQGMQNTINKVMKSLISEEENINSEPAYLTENSVQECLDYLVKDAMVDPLTLTYNRRYISRHIKSLYRNNATFSVILIDIDHFKIVNDTYGHNIGDQILCEFVAILKKHCRPHDVVARWGGEEFLIILEAVSLENAKKRAQTLQSKIAENRFRTVGNLTASFGVIENPLGTHNFDLVIKHADQALYQAKQNGRNRVEVNKVMPKETMK